MQIPRRKKPATGGCCIDSYFVIALCKVGLVVMALGTFLFYHALSVTYYLPTDALMKNPLFSTSTLSRSCTQSILSMGETDSDVLSLASRESLGFFTDIHERSWNLLKKRFQDSRPNEYRGSKKIYRDHANHPNYFWQENYDPEFTCLNEAKFGGLGDGGKWVCDAHRIDKENCLVYSIGSHGDFSFESSVLHGVSSKCEIHTFDRDIRFNQKQFDVLAKEAGVEFHHVMLGEATNRYPNGKRFREIIKDLKHEGRTIDIMKIDCEGCEWDQYTQWIEDFQETRVTVRQILIELHKSPLPNVADFFHRMLELGYVIFHKEANFLNAECVEMAFILLDKEFQTAMVG